MKLKNLHSLTGMVFIRPLPILGVEDKKKKKTKRIKKTRRK